MDLKTLLRAQWDRAAGAAAAALGLIVLALGWYGVSGTPELGKQVPYFISGGIGGMFLLGLGGILWLSADLRDQWRELRRIRVGVEAAAQVARPTTNGRTINGKSANGSTRRSRTKVQSPS
jgi:hypothetical protein